MKKKKRKKKSEKKKEIFREREREREREMHFHTGANLLAVLKLEADGASRGTGARYRTSDRFTNEHPACPL